MPPWGRKPDYVWRYKNKEGQTLFLITRTDGNDKKFYCPWSFASDGKWVKKHWPTPRPLYNLDKITVNPTKNILIVEGEKAADAAQSIVGDSYIVTTWASGSNSFDKTDWSPIKGRKVLIWPDADEPGAKASDGICNILYNICPEIKVLSVGDMRPLGWDAANSDFKSMDSFIQWAKPRAQVRKPPPQPREPQVTQRQEPIPLPGYPEQRKPEHAAIAFVDQENMPQTHDPSKVALWMEIGIAVNPNTYNPHCNLDNITRILSRYKPLKNIVWYDEFHFKYYTNWKSKTVREWQDQDDYELTAYIQKHLGIHRITDDLVRKGVIMYAQNNKRNEIKDWMSALKWDETPRVHNFFNKYFGALESDYTTAVSKNFLISLVARVFKPGCKVDNMVILEGPQGKFKSTALSVIGGRWYVESNESMGSKDFYQIFQGKLIVELGELDSFNKAEITTIKKVVSTATDRFRPPYGKAPRDFPRQCVFVGTTNESNYLRDHTGARRFWPIKITDIDLGALQEDREQLFAEAVHLLKSGAEWHQVPDSAMSEQEKRREQDPWEDEIKEFITTTRQEFFTTIDVARHVGFDTSERIDFRVSRRVAKVLRVLGCVPGKNRVGVNMTVKAGWFKPDALSYQVISKSNDNVRQQSLPNYAPQ